MSYAIIRRSGGYDEYLLEVVNGRGEPSGTPSAPTIYVDTTTSINSYNITATSGPTYSTNDGKVNIAAKITSNSNDIDIIDSNNFYILPTKLHQYIDGVWKPKVAYYHTAKSGASWVLFSTIEETFTKDVTSGTTGRDESYGEWGAVHIELPAGETFRIDNITFEQRIYTNIDCDLYVNGAEVWNYNAISTEYKTVNTGVIGTYTAVSGKTAIMLRIRGWDSSGSWNGTFTNTATITYTTGV